MRRMMMIVLIAAALAVVIAVGAYMLIQRGERELMDHKTARDTTGVVLDKMRVQFGSKQTEYRDDEGRMVGLDDWRRKSGELRILYKIDNFNQIPEAHRSAVVSAEDHRSRSFGPRFYIVDQETFDRVKAGQAVRVVYRWASDSEIEIIFVQLANQRSEGAR